MRIIEPSVEFLTDAYFDTENVTKLIELAGRTCYKSEARITEESADKFIRNIVSNNHESVIEHFSYTVRIVCDRATSHQLVRHRLASYSQESQRYINYMKRGDIGFITPRALIEKPVEFQLWLAAVTAAEKNYFDLIEAGIKPEVARSVLPNATKTEIVVTANLRQWRHIFKERLFNSHAQEDIRHIMRMIYDHMVQKFPVVFKDME